MVYYCTLCHDLGFYMYFLCIFMVSGSYKKMFFLGTVCCVMHLIKKHFYLGNRIFISFYFICLSSSDKNAFIVSFISLPWIYSELCISLLFLFPYSKHYSISIRVKQSYIDYSC
ncbi:hypothetical protein AMTRI_Chr05g58640 [Amborella trichopoda]